MLQGELANRRFDSIRGQAVFRLARCGHTVQKGSLENHQHNL